MRAQSLAVSSTWLAKVLFVAALAGLLFTAVTVAGGLTSVQLAQPLGVIFLATASYLLGHLLRIARLALLSADARISLRELAKVHFFTSGVSLVTPFKLGEVYRVAELSILTQSPVRGLILVWLERVFDVVVILGLLLLASMAQTEAIASFGGVLALSVFFVLMTLFLLVLLPDNLRRMGSYIIRRYDADWTVGFLWLIAELRGVIGQMSQMLRGRRLSLLVFTAMIWTFEGLSLALVLSTGAGVYEPVTGLLSFLSLATQGETLATYLSGGTAGAVATALVSYVLATQGVLLAVSIVAGFVMVRSRLMARNLWKI